jgi:hypothetical protein
VNRGVSGTLLELRATGRTADALKRACPCRGIPYKSARRGFQGFGFFDTTPSASAFATSRRMASDLLMPVSFAQDVIAAIISLGKRAPNRGSFPVAGRPLFLGLTFIDFAIKRLYLKNKPRGSSNFRPGSNQTQGVEDHAQG